MYFVIIKNDNMYFRDTEKRNRWKQGGDRIGLSEFFIVKHLDWEKKLRRTSGWKYKKLFKDYKLPNTKVPKTCVAWWLCRAEYFVT